MVFFLRPSRPPMLGLRPRQISPHLEFGQVELVGADLRAPDEKAIPMPVQERGGTGMRRNDIMNQVNQLILYVSEAATFRIRLDCHLIRAAMVFTFFAFSIQKWSQYTAEMLVPLISHSPVVFWLLPAFGVRGAGYFLGMTEMIFGSLIFLGYWRPRLGILGALGSMVTFIGTTSIIPFLPNGWAHEAGGFPIMTLPLGFLMKDVLFLVASFYLLKQDLTRAALEVNRAERPDISDRGDG
jgi:uncharacterized membrane protein YkgB